MAAGWLSVLKAVPWSDVIGAAPQVTEGAKKLWDAVAKKPPRADHAAPTEDPVATRLAKAEIALADLHTQLLASAEIIARLADQNAQLIARMEAAQVRLRWLGWTSAAAVLAAVAAIVIALPT